MYILWTTYDVIVDAKTSSGIVDKLPKSDAGDTYCLGGIRGSIEPFIVFRTAASP